MRTPALISLVTLLALPLVAGAQIYSWKDASGKTIYSDRPPLEKKVQTRELMSGKTTGGEPTEPANKEKAGEGKASAEAKAGNETTSAKNPEDAKAEADARQKLCDNARSQLTVLQKQGIVITKDAKGEDTPLVGEARKAAAEQATKDVAHWCK